MLLNTACDETQKGPPAELTGDTTPTVAEIGHWLARTRKLTVSKVECPPKVPVRKGFAFTCRASIKGGGQIEVVVEFTNRSGELKITLRHPVVIAAEVEAAVKGDAGSRRVDCGERVREAVRGATFRCDVHEGMVTEQVEVTVVNASGGVRWRFVVKDAAPH